MNAYFFKMSKEEKNNILDQHKELYNGYAANNTRPNTQPLYTQDFANDKNGITVNNKGVVMTYKNIGINENSISPGSKFEPENTFEEEYVSLGEKLDMIGDGPLDLPNGTVDLDDESETMFSIDDFDEIEFNDDDDFEELEFNDDDDWEEDVFGDEFDDEDKGKIAFNIQESLNMFNRFKNYN
jgi:hypothetical protein